MAMLAISSPFVAAAIAAAANLIPAEPAREASYYTTWGSQGYCYGASQNLSLADYVQNGTKTSHAYLDYEHLFGTGTTCGWASRFHPRARKDLFFVLDAGWAEEGKESAGTGDVLNLTKFTEFSVLAFFVLYPRF